MSTNDRKALLDKLGEHNWWKLDKIVPDPGDRDELLWESLKAGQLWGTAPLGYLAQHMGKRRDTRAALDYMARMPKPQYRFFHNGVEGWDWNFERLLEALIAADAKGVKGYALPDPLDDLAEILLRKAGVVESLSPKAATRLAQAYLAETWDDGEISKLVTAIAPEEGWPELLLDAVEEPSATTVHWPRIRDHVAGATPTQRVAIVTKNNNVEVYGLASEVLRPLGMEHIGLVESEIEAQLSNASYYISQPLGTLIIAAVLIRRDAGVEVPELLEGALIQMLKLSGFEGIEALAQALEALEPAQRSRVVRAALSEGGPGVRVEALVGLSQDEETLTAALEHAKKYFSKHTPPETLARGIARFGEMAVEPLCARLRGGGVPASAEQIYIVALGEIGAPAAAETLVAELGAKAKAPREAAEQALIRLGAAARPALEEGGKAKKKAIRESCQSLLGGLTLGDTPLAELEARLATLDDPELEAALDESASLWGEGLKERLAPSIEKHGALVFARACARFLSTPNDWNQQSILQRVLEVVRDDPSTAWLMVDVIARLPKLYRYYENQFVNNLETCGDKVVPPIVATLRRSTPRLTAQLLGLLVQHSEKPDKAILLESLTSSSKSVRLVAVNGATKWGEAIVDDLAALLSSKKKDARLAAAQALAQVPAAGAVDALRAALEAEKSDEVITELEKALESAGGSPLSAAGGSAVEAVEAGEVDVVALLEAQKVPKKLPPLADLTKLPRLELAAGGELGDKATLGLIARLIKEGPDNQDALARQARQALSDASATAFSRALVKAWMGSGQPSGQKWAIYQLALLGSEDQLDELAPDLDNLASAGKHHLARWIIDVLLRHGSTAGHSWLLHWSKAGEKKTVIKTAKANLAAAAEAAGKSIEAFSVDLNTFIADDVADRNVPTLGLEAGPIEVDYGKRKFQIKLNQNLDLVVQDVSSLELFDTLPKPRKGETAGADKAMVSAMKKQLRRALKGLTTRLEYGMVSGRSWKLPAFRRLFLGHPIVSTFAARLVFRADDGTLFTVSEEQLVNTDWDEVALEKDATIRLVHRLEMSDEAATGWGQFLAESEIIQPFQQLDRPVYTLADHPLPATGAAGAVARLTLVGRLKGLGWRNGPAEDAGMVYEAQRLYAGRNVRAFVTHEGFYIGDPTAWEPQEEIEVQWPTFRDLTNKPLKAEELDPIVYSEIRYELDRLLAS